MLKQHNQFVLTLLVVADALAVATAWVVSYYLRFEFLHVDPAKGTPELGDVFLPMLPLVVPAHLVIFYRVGLYQPRRVHSLWSEVRDIMKAFVVAVVAVVVIDYAFPSPAKISRRFVLVYAVLGSGTFVLFRLTLRLILRALRQHGRNQRDAAIVGRGRNAQRLLHALRNNAWTGLRVRYFVDERQRERPGELHGLPVYGPLEDFARIYERDPVDAVFLALPAEQQHRADEVLRSLENSYADVRIVPEVDPAYAVAPQVGELDGVPILSLRQSPLYGWNAVLKRTFDVIVGTLSLIVATVPMLIIALLIKATSRGPVFYRQVRVGLDGRVFRLIKFRTMRADAERETGPVWSTRDDPRRTPIGRFLRRTSLDELPNLFNVLAGQMSLVGPRPERPEFIEQFRQEVPRYMLRHKIKAGMTGLAQVRGHRGENSSLRKRIQYDVNYINNWSLLLDARILVQTALGVWFSRHET